MAATTASATRSTTRPRRANSWRLAVSGASPAPTAAVAQSRQCRRCSGCRTPRSAPSSSRRRRPRTPPWPPRRLRQRCAITDSWPRRRQPPRSVSAPSWAARSVTSSRTRASASAPCASSSSSYRRSCSSSPCSSSSPSSSSSRTRSSSRACERRRKWWRCALTITRRSRTFSRRSSASSDYDGSSRVRRWAAAWRRPHPRLRHRCSERSQCSRRRRLRKPTSSTHPRQFENAAAAVVVDKRCYGDSVLFGVYACATRVYS